MIIFVNILLRIDDQTYIFIDQSSSKCFVLKHDYNLIILSDSDGPFLFTIYN